MKKTILVDNQKVILELRVCSMKLCQNTFWVNQKHIQSICSEECYQITTNLRSKGPKFKDSLPKPKKAQAKDQKQRFLQFKNEVRIYY